jgi:hypothetical protein
MTDSHVGPPLVDPVTASLEVTAALEKLPLINLFRAMAGAADIYPAFADYVVTLLHGFELPRGIARFVPLVAGNVSARHYVWRRNVVAAKSVGSTLCRARMCCHWFSEVPTGQMRRFQSGCHRQLWPHTTSGEAGRNSGCG